MLVPTISHIDRQSIMKECGAFAVAISNTTMDTSTVKKAAIKAI